MEELIGFRIVRRQDNDYRFLYAQNGKEYDVHGRNYFENAICILSIDDIKGGVKEERISLADKL